MTDSPTAATLASTTLVDSAPPERGGVRAPARDRQHRPRARGRAARRGARWLSLRPVPGGPVARRHARQQRDRARHRLVRAQGRAAGGGVPRGGHSGAAGLCRRAQPPEHRAHAPHDADRPVHLARLHRHLDRRRMAQGHAGVQPRAVRTLWSSSVGVQRPRRFDLPPVRPRRQPAHGVREPARQLRRHAAGAHRGRLRAGLSALDPSRSTTCTRPTSSPKSIARCSRARHERCTAGERKDATNRRSTSRAVSRRWRSAATTWR